MLPSGSDEAPPSKVQSLPATQEGGLKAAIGDLFGGGGGGLVVVRVVVVRVVVEWPPPVVVPSSALVVLLASDVADIVDGLALFFGFLVVELAGADVSVGSVV